MIIQLSKFVIQYMKVITKICKFSPSVYVITHLLHLCKSSPNEDTHLYHNVYQHKGYNNLGGNLYTLYMVLFPPGCVLWTILTQNNKVYFLRNTLFSQGDDLDQASLGCLFCLFSSHLNLWGMFMYLGNYFKL